MTEPHAGALRVLVVTIVHVPLDARIYHRQIRALREAGAAVTYAAPFTGYGIDSSVAEVGRTVDLPRAAGRDRLRALEAARVLIARHAADHDLVVLHDPELLAAVAGLRGLPPVVWDVHEDTAASLTDRPWVPDAVRPAAAAAVRLAERWAERRFHLTLAEEGYADRFAHAHPVVPNVPFLPDAPRDDWDDRVVYVGRVSARRGAHELVGLARELSGEVAVEVAGPADDDVADLLADADREGALTWHGFVPNDRALTLVDGALAGLSLLHDEPNYRHSMPTKILEYLAHGVPAVTTPLPVARRIVEGEDAGVVVPFGDVPATADAVRALQADPSRRAALGRRGREAVAARWSWDAAGPAFVDQLRRWADAP